MSEYAAYASRHYDETLAKVVARLRSVADEVERDGKARDEAFLGVPRHAGGATRAVHAVMWGLANANLDGLMSAAAEADHAARVPMSDPVSADRIEKENHR